MIRMHISFKQESNHIVQAGIEWFLSVDRKSIGDWKLFFTQHTKRREERERAEFGISTIFLTTPYWLSIDDRRWWWQIHINWLYLYVYTNYDRQVILSSVVNSGEKTNTCYSISSLSNYLFELNSNRHHSDVFEHAIRSLRQRKSFICQYIIRDNKLFPECEDTEMNRRPSTKNISMT